jgi:hypothetical protein
VVTPAMKMVMRKRRVLFNYNSRGVLNRRMNGRDRAFYDRVKKFFPGLRETVIYSRRILASIKYSWRILLDFGRN